MRILDFIVCGAVAFEAVSAQALKLPLTKLTPAAVAKRSLLKRQTVGTPDENYMKDLLFLVELEIGTPPQMTKVQLDTGSSDLVVETDTSDICMAGTPNPCTNYGPYKSKDSSTYHYIDSDLNVLYGGRDGATGDWVSDTISIGGAMLNSAQFGIMLKSTIVEGILGVSFEEIESRAYQSEGKYPNFPTLLVSGGYIASRTFSLWTKNDASSGGTLLLGGVDTAKFIAPLQTIDLIPAPDSGNIEDFRINLLGVSGLDENKNPVALMGGDDLAIELLLDSGTTLTKLPTTLTHSIWTFVGAVASDSDPTQAFILCSQRTSTEVIQFAFKGITISVPLSQLVIFPSTVPEDVTCEFGITISDNTPIIGDTVLAAMYVVYDLDNKQVSLANTVFDATAENIMPIPAGPNKVPGAIPPQAVSSSSVVASSTTLSSSTLVSSAVLTSIALSSYTSAVETSLASSTALVESSFSSAMSQVSATFEATSSFGTTSPLTTSSFPVSSSPILPLEASSRTILTSSFGTSAVTATSSLASFPSSSCVPITGLICGDNANSNGNSGTDYFGIPDLAACVSSCLTDSTCGGYFFSTGNSVCEHFVGAAKDVEVPNSNSPYQIYDIGCFCPASTSALIISGSTAQSTFASSITSQSTSPTFEASSLSSTTLEESSTSAFITSSVVASSTMDSTSSISTQLLATTPSILPSFEQISSLTISTTMAVLPSSSSFSFTTSIITTTTILSPPPPPIINRPAKCNNNNCLRAIVGATATAFCSSFQAGLPVPTPANINKGCDGDLNRVLSGCACFYTAPVVGPPATIPPPATTALPVTPPAKCNTDNCLRAIKRAGPAAVCEVFGEEASGGVPSAVQKGCDEGTRVQSACACLVTVN